jgi:hypothetical protein
MVRVKVIVRLTVSQSVCLSWCRAPIWAHDQILVTVLSLWGALSDERTGLPFVRVIVCSNVSCHNVHYIYILHVMHVIKCMYIQYTGVRGSVVG